MNDVRDEELGPIDYMVVGFPAGAKNFTGEMAEQLVALVDTGTIRVLDLLILEKDANGEVEGYEIEDLGDLGALAVLESSVAEILATRGRGTPGRRHGAWKHSWRPGLGELVGGPVRGGGPQVGRPAHRGGRIPTQALIAAFEADAASTEGA